MIGIRVDSNNKIGLGHIMRCLSIADQLACKGEEVIFIVTDSVCSNIVLERGFKYHLLSSSYNELEKEIEELKNVFKIYNISKVLIDSYFVTEKYLNDIRQEVEIIYLNDFYKFKYNVDAIINYNIFSDTINYEKDYGNDKVFKGTEFVPLRSNMCKYENYKLKKNVKNILITTGGTDINSSNIKIVEAIINNRIFDDINFCVVIGKYFDSYEELEKLTKEKKNITLLKGVNNLMDYIYNSDIVISAAGFTLYEIAYIGVPSILISNGGNLVKDAFEKRQAMLYGGDFNNLDIDLLFKNINKLILDFELRKKLNYRLKKIVDGKGASRIADIIINI